MFGFIKIFKFMYFLGFDFRIVASWRFLPRYIFHYLKFIRLGGRVSRFYPILTDFTSEAGTAKGHYFHQDLLVAQHIFNRKPMRHIDIGSRIDGFVAHLASFREVEVMDVRELNSDGHEQIVFTQCDLMRLPKDLEGSSDSVSSLHALEHFGLGRYGDPLDPNGHIKGFEALAKMVSPGGILYLSFPISHMPRIEFNAHRVLDPNEPLIWASNLGDLKLREFHFVDDKGDLHRNARLTDKLPLVHFGLGIYIFTKTSRENG